MTKLLGQARAGDPSARERLFPLVYDELRQLAVASFQSQRADHTLRPTALVHEAWIKLSDQTAAPAERVHFFALAARTMRQLLVAHARATVKREGVRAEVTVSGLAAALGTDALGVLLLDGVRVFVSRERVDFRKGIAGLYAVVRDHVRADALSGHLHLFLRAQRRARWRGSPWFVRGRRSQLAPLLHHAQPGRARLPGQGRRRSERSEAASRACARGPSPSGAPSTPTCRSRLGRRTFCGTWLRDAETSLLDQTEPLVTDVRVEEAQGRNRLGTIGPVVEHRVPSRRDVLKPEGMVAVHPHGERCFAA